MSALLPPFSLEIAAQIISYHLDDPVSLSRLCQVSKSLYGYVIPLLYHTYSQCERHGLEDIDVGLFLRTVFARPDLAAHVKRIKLGSWDGHETDSPVSKSPDGKSDGPEDEGHANRTDDEQPLGEDSPITDVDEGEKEYRNHCRRAISWISSSWPADCDRDNLMKRGWLRDAYDRQSDAMVALLLATVPNLEQFFFSEVYRPLYVIFVWEMAARLYEASNPGQAVLRSQTSSQVPWEGFKQLHSIRTESEESKYGYLGMCDLDPVYRLPSMRGLEVGLANSAYTPERDAHSNMQWRYDVTVPNVFVLTPASSPITKLSYFGAAMNRQTIRPLLAVFKGLTHFYYSYGRIHMYDTHFTANDLRSALTPHQQTLEVLNLNLDDDWEKVGWEDIPHEQLYFNGQGLRAFGKLKTLICSQQALLGVLHAGPPDTFGDIATDEYVLEPPPEAGPHRLVELLPASIEKLRIGVCDTRVLSHVKELVDAKKGDGARFPHLRRIDLMFAMETTPPQDVSLGEIGDLEDLSIHVCFTDKESRDNYSESKDNAWIARWWFEDQPSMFGHELMNDHNWDRADRDASD